MQRQEIKSSRIKSIGYSEIKQTLEIEFNKGGIYQYKPVNKDLYSRLISAPSQGKFFGEFIMKDKNIKVSKLQT